MSNFQKPRSVSRKIPWPLVAVFLLLTAGLSALSWVFYTVQIKHARAFMESELATVAGLKVEQIVRWRAEVLAFARALQENRANGEVAKLLAGDPAPESARTRFLTGMRGLQKSLPLSKSSSCFRAARTLATYPEGQALPSMPESARQGHDAWQDGKPLLGTVVLDEKTGLRSIEMTVPLLDGEGTGKPVALLGMSFDAAAEIDPLLVDWPNRRDSAEALLLQRRGREVRPSQPSPALRRRDASRRPSMWPASAARPRRKPWGRKVSSWARTTAAIWSSRISGPSPDTRWLVAVKTDLADLDIGDDGRYPIPGVRGGGPDHPSPAPSSTSSGSGASPPRKRPSGPSGTRPTGTWTSSCGSLIGIMPNPAFFKDTEGATRARTRPSRSSSASPRKSSSARPSRDVAPAGDRAQAPASTTRPSWPSPATRSTKPRSRPGTAITTSSSSSRPTSRPDGTTGGIIGILRDITQRLRAEEELDQLRKFSDSTIQTMTEGLVLTDSEGKFSFVNPAAAAMLGYTPGGDGRPRSRCRSCPRTSRSSVRRVDEERTKGISGRYELGFLHRNGTRRTLLVSGGPRLPGRAVRRDAGRPDRHHRAQSLGGGGQGPVPARRADDALATAAAS
ncbi:MAG: PAS domain-containing protein [Candidatus Moduliflexus flocculans]|nr:PAS domain-containing protein [Candidatus Moduliflexus flocculans]